MTTLIAGSQTAQPPEFCPKALWVTNHGQQMALLVYMCVCLGGSYPSAKVQLAYSTAPPDKVSAHTDMSNTKKIYTHTSGKMSTSTWA